MKIYFLAILLVFLGCDETPTTESTSPPAVTPPHNPTGYTFRFVSAHTYAEQTNLLPGYYEECLGEPITNSDSTIVDVIDTYAFPSNSSPNWEYVFGADSVHFTYLGTGSAYTMPYLWEVEGDNKLYFWDDEYQYSTGRPYSTVMTSDSTFYIDFEADCDSGSPCWNADTEEESD